AFSPDGTQILSGSGDGTIRLWDKETGKEIASFISFSGSDFMSGAVSRGVDDDAAEEISAINGEWICITPDGYYAASPRADRYLNVRIGNKVTGIDSFREVFYNPDVVEARLTGKPDPASKRDISIQDAAGFFPSTITLQASTAAVINGKANLAVNIVDDNQPIQSVKIFVNGNLIGGNDLAAAAGAQGLQAEKASLTVTGNQKSLSFTIPLALDPGDNIVEVVSFNGYAESRRNINIGWQTGDDYKPALPNLWIMAVGINSYTDNGINSLNYCANDAREIIRSFKAQEGKNYAKVNTLLIADGEELEPTANTIRENLGFLEGAGPRDVILLFLAGHGANGKDGMFEFLPNDAVRNPDGTISNVITGEEIDSVLETPGKRLIFIDACHSGGIDNNRIVRQLMNTNAYVFTSSRGNELSLELPQLGHGVFSYSIIDTLKNPAARTGGYLSVIGLSGTVSADVSNRTNNQQNPMGYSLGFSDFIIGE
ncbi:MAG: caspase family protein, partial [Treponema sp.]|nr:caspase family protein [Treponema sp.]